MLSSSGGSGLISPVAWPFLGRLPADLAEQVCAGRTSGSLAKSTHITKLLKYKETSSAAVYKRLENRERGKNLKGKSVAENNVHVGVAGSVSWSFLSRPVLVPKMCFIGLMTW